MLWIVPGEVEQNVNDPFSSQRDRVRQTRVKTEIRTKLLDKVSDLGCRAWSILFEPW